MKALRFEDGTLALADMPRPKAEGESRIRVKKSGICNTDIEIVRGYAGFQGTIGHEFVGVVESSSRVELVGKRVVGEINAGCGKCRLCESGDPRQCRSRTVLGIVGRDGAHAEYLTLPDVNLFEVPETVTDEQAVFTEPLAAAIGITEQIDVSHETRVAVIGDGKLGILCALSLGLRSNNVTLIGRHRDKLAIAEAQGVEGILGGEASKLLGGFDVVVEASGSKSGFADAVDLVRPRGKIVLKSTVHGRAEWEPSRIVVDEITVVGSRCGRFEPALEILAAGQIDIMPMISYEFRLRDGVAAMAKAQERGVLKVLLSQV